MKILKIMLLFLGGVYFYNTSMALAQNMVEVPSVLGMKLEDAKKVLKNSSLKVGMISDAANGCLYDVDQIAEQKPAAKETVKKNTKVDLAVNKEEPNFVPNVKGDTTTEADKKFAEAGLIGNHLFTWKTNVSFPRYPCCEFDVSGTRESDEIFRTDPAIGENMACQQDKINITTYREKWNTYICTFGVMNGELCP